MNCNPLGGSIGYLPNWIAFRELQCDQHSRKVQMLMRLSDFGEFWVHL